MKKILIVIVAMAAVEGSSFAQNGEAQKKQKRQIEPNGISSASMSDTRIYPSLNWTHMNAKTGNLFGFTCSYTYKQDYE